MAKRFTPDNPRIIPPPIYRQTNPRPGAVQLPGGGFMSPGKRKEIPQLNWGWVKKLQRKEEPPVVMERKGIRQEKHRRFVPKSDCTNEGEAEIAIPKMAGNYAPMEAAVQKVD